jgi:hypothetical protein
MKVREPQRPAYRVEVDSGDGEDVKSAYLGPGGAQHLIGPVDDTRDCAEVLLARLRRRCCRESGAPGHGPGPLL